MAIFDLGCDTEREYFMSGDEAEGVRTSFDGVIAKR